MHFSVYLPLSRERKKKQSDLNQLVRQGKLSYPGHSFGQCSSHNGSSVFHRPHIFEGWFDSTSEQLKLMERSFFVFSYGTRRCIGEAYGALQVKTLIGSLCLQYQMELDSDSPRRQRECCSQGLWMLFRLV